MESITYLQHAPFFTFLTGLIDTRHPTHQPIRILEVGCRSGEFAHLLKNYYKDKIEVTGIDPMATETNDRDITIIKQKLLDWNTESQYDVVLFTKSLHHCEELKEAVQRAHDLLVPGGLLVAEELQPEKADDATLVWLFDRIDLMTAARSIKSDHPAIVDTDRSPRERYDAIHKAHWYHPSQAVKKALLSVFPRAKMVEQVPGYHFHLPLFQLEDSIVGRSILTEFMKQEDRALAQHAIIPFAFTVVAEK